MQEAVNELKEAASGEEDGDIPRFWNRTAKSLPAADCVFNYPLTISPEHAAFQG